MKRGAALWILALALAGCGADDGADSGSALGGSGSGGGPGLSEGSVGGAANPSGGASSAIDNSLFSPQVELEYVGTVVEPGMEVTAMTLREDWLNDVVWLAAIRNTSMDPLCAIIMEVSFLDASGLELGAAQGTIEVPMVRGVSGTGSLTQCLSPGQTGMIVDPFPDLAPESIPNVARMTYAFDAMILTDAVPTNDITVTDVQIIDEGNDRYHFTGTLNNNAGDSVSNPAVSIFGTNAVGRPLAEGSAIDLITVTAGGSWHFETLSFYVPVVDYVAFPRVSDL